MLITNLPSEITHTFAELHLNEHYVITAIVKRSDLVDFSPNDKLNVLHNGTWQIVQPQLIELPSPSINYCSPTTLIELACNHFSITTKQLLSPTREQHVSNVRAAIAYVFYHTYKLSHGEVTKLLNRVHHTSSIHWCKHAQPHYIQQIQHMLKNEADAM